MVLLNSAAAELPPAYHRFIVAAAHLLSGRLPGELVVTSRFLNMRLASLYGAPLTPAERWAVVRALLRDPANAFFAVSRDGRAYVYVVAGVVRCTHPGSLNTKMTRFVFARIDRAQTTLSVAPRRYAAAFTPLVSPEHVEKVAAAVRLAARKAKAAGVVAA